MNVIIVGSGPSVKAVDPSDILNSGAHVIAVNGAIEWLGGADSWFTLDPSVKNIHRMINRVEGVKYYAAVDTKNRRKIPPGVTILNRLSNPPVRSRFKDTPQYWFLRWGCRTGLCETPSSVNSGNSAYGALGLAYHWKPEKILLLGVDGSTEGRVDGNGPPDFSLDHLPVLFKTANKQLQKNNIQVMNGSKDSKVTCFPRVTPREGLKWIKQK